LGLPIYPQGANTALTGGSVPRSDNGIAINMRRLNKIVALDDEASLVLTFGGLILYLIFFIVYSYCLGAGIHDLSTFLAKLNRDSHTALGSSFLNPTGNSGVCFIICSVTFVCVVAAGIALGSGGVLMRKGSHLLFCCVFS
jgi:hypothetical protein